MKYEFEIGAPDAGRKIERFVARALQDPPYSLVQRLLRSGKVRINGNKASAGESIAAGDVVIIHHRAPEEPAERKTAPARYAGPELKLLYRSRDYLALNKAAGISCSEDGRVQYSVQGWLRSSLENEIDAGDIRPELCHRLDRGTTGVVLVALNSMAFTRFHEASGDERPRKRYSLICWGRAPSPHWSVERPLLRLPHAVARGPKVLSVEATTEGAKAARTDLNLLAQAKEACLLAAELRSGRTHQIRAHLLAEGLPIVGDPRYGDTARDRSSGLSALLEHQALHAVELDFHDEGRLQTVRAAEPPEFLRALKRLRLTTR